MSLLIFQHHAQEAPAALGRALQHHGHRLRIVELHARHQVPPDLDDIDGIVSMGGPMNVDQTESFPWLQPEMDYLKRAHEAGVPMVGICLGAQLIAQAMGATVEPMSRPEVGWHKVRLTFPGTIDPIYAGITWDSMQFHIHGQQVTELPSGATPLAGSEVCKNQAFRLGMTTYGFQYHFEWDQQELELIASNGLVGKAGLKPDDITAPMGQFYAAYRRRGDRLCDTIGQLLFA